MVMVIRAFLIQVLAMYSQLISYCENHNKVPTDKELDDFELWYLKSAPEDPDAEIMSPDRLNQWFEQQLN